MVDQRIDQWYPGEMPTSWMEERISRGEVYVVAKEAELVGSVTLTWADPFIWGEDSQGAGYMHMLMVARSHSGQGMGSALLAWAEHRIADSGRDRARLDSVTRNARLRRYYEHLGYRRVAERVFAAEPTGALNGAIPSATTLYEKLLLGQRLPLRA